jgi:hypothetical protein
MHPILAQEIAAQHVAELHRQAAKQRVIHELRTDRERNSPPHRTVWQRLPLRRSRPATT